ncbi:MAG: patatin-like phospholipase family protein [Candidatus Dormibacteria bacterium]
MSAGGVVGHAYHAGVLAAIEQGTGWDPRDAEVIVGTSAGSLVAALLRGGLTASDLAARSMGRRVSIDGRALEARIGRRPPIQRQRRLPGIPHAASTTFLMEALRHPFRVNPVAVAAAAMPMGRLPITPVVGGVQALFDGPWPARATWIAAVDMDSGRRVVFGREGAPAARIADAVAASCAIPGYFAPVTIGGRRYIDGGVHSLTNARVLAGLGLDLVLVSSSMTAGRDGVGLSIDSPFRALGGLRVSQEASAIRSGGTPVVVFQPTRGERVRMGINDMQGSHRREITALAKETTLARMATPGARDWRSILEDARI